MTSDFHVVADHGPDGSCTWCRAFDRQTADSIASFRGLFDDATAAGPLWISYVSGQDPAEGYPRVLEEGGDGNTQMPTWDELRQAYYRSHYRRRQEAYEQFRLAIIASLFEEQVGREEIEGDLDRPVNLDPDAEGDWWSQPHDSMVPIPAMTLDQLLGDDVAELIAQNRLPERRPPPRTR